MDIECYLVIRKRLTESTHCFHGEQTAHLHNVIIIQSINIINKYQIDPPTPPPPPLDM